jgi:uncharacterized protein
MAPWPWWLGGPALAAVVLGHVLFTGRALGVSGIFRRLAFWRAERAVERSRAELTSDAAALEQALLAATAEEAGLDPSALAALAALAAGPAAPDEPLPAVPAAAAPPPLLGQAIFLGGIVAGGWLAHRLGAGDAGGAAAASPAIPGAHGSWLWLTMAAGGLLAGVGTSLAGGCASGHGLSGCARLRPASLLATGSFLAAALALTRLGALAGW